MKFVFVVAALGSIPATFHHDALSLLAQHGFLIKKKEDNKIYVEGSQDTDLRSDLIELSDKFQLDLALIPEEIFLTPKKLVVFDMDSTLIQQEVIDEMAEAFGIGSQVKQITKRAMNGEMNFDQSLSERVGLLRGLDKKSLTAISERLTLVPGAEKLIKILKHQGIRTVIASGGFSFFAEKIRERLSIDEVYSNTLVWNDQTLTGKVSGDIVNAEYKAALLERLATREKIDLSQTVAVGDGANDIPMLLKAGLGFAFHAKEKVRREARHQLHYGPMNTLLHFLNIPGDHLS